MSNADTDPFWGDPFWGDDGYVALKLIVKNPGTPPGHCNQIGAHVRIRDRVNLGAPLENDALLKDVLLILTKRLLRAVPPGK